LEFLELLEGREEELELREARPPLLLLELFLLEELDEL
jgi:hypothetical protein